jgi:N4-gp56 family major capsid protein
MAGQIWAVNSLGGFFYSQNLSDELREALQPMSRFRQFCDVKDASQQGKGKGQTFTWDVVANVATAGGTLVETNTMPETQFTITQATLTINEYGNSVPYSGKLEALSKFEVRKPVMQALRNDAVKTFDRASWVQFNLTKLRAIASSGTDTASITLYTNGTVTGTNNVAFGTPHLKNIVDTMKERNIPAYTNDDYVGIAWPSTLRGMKNTLETIHQYTIPGIQLIFNAEIGRYENVRFVEQTNIPKGANLGSPLDGSNGTAWVNAKSDWIFFFGEDTIAEGVAIPEEMRAKIPTDFGRSKGVAWYYLGGFGIVQTQASETRIVVWDSLA